MASAGNRDIVPGIPICDVDGKRRKYLNTANGKIEDLPTQKMVFDTETGKLMAVVSEKKSIALDNKVFTEVDADGFFGGVIKPLCNYLQFISGDLFQHKAKYIYKIRPEFTGLMNVQSKTKY